MMNLPFRHARAALAAIALLTVTCRDVNVTAVDVARIEISPAAPSVEVAQTTPLVARVLSGGGRELQGRTVQWQTRDPSIATVSASGVVSGVAAGTTHIRAATEGVADSVSITVTPRPQIQLAADDVQFSAVQGAASPAAQTVAVSNGGGGSLTGLSAAVSYDAGQPSGWLTATLAATTAPTTLTLAAATGSLPVGSHTARVLVAAPTAANAPVTITVTFSIGPVPPSAPTSLTAGVVSSSQVHLAWAAAGGTVGEYRIERRTGATGAWTQLASISAGTLTYESTGLAAATQYLYRVRACNDSGCSPYSNEATATTHPLPPGAPGTLTATAASSSAIDLAWGAASGTVAEYVVERRTGGGAYTVIDSVVGATALQDAGLAAATGYTYRVRACNPGGCSAYGNEASATTLPATPGAPASLAATAASSAAIDLAWTAASGTVNEYRIERRAAGEASFTLRTTVAGTTTAWRDAGLTPATAYTYRVQACNVSGCSPFSNEASAATLPLPPGAPAALSATTASSSQIDLAWSAASGTVDEYVIERRTGAGTYAVVDTVTATSFSNTGLAAATTYTYRVRACNSGGCSPYSNEAVATTYPPAPGAPTALVATPTSSTEVQLGWTAATGTVDAYVIERRTGPGTFVVIDTVAGTTFPDSGLAPATTYTYHVQACNTGGCSAFSNQASATTFPLPPGTPGTLTATTISASRIDLAWGAASGTVTGYVIERRTGAGTYAVIDTVSGATTFQNIGLTAETPYVYRVRACNAGGCSAYGNEATATTLPLPPGAPTLTAAAVDDSSIDLSWSVATGTIESYRVERVNPDPAVIAVLDDLILSHRDVGLEPATTYTYRVQACNAGGCSPFSNEATVTTLPSDDGIPER